MGCGASSRNFVQQKEVDPTLPDNGVTDAVPVNSLTDVVKQQKGDGATHGNGIRVAQIIQGKSVDEFYDMQTVLGTGMSGSVWRAKNKVSGSQIAVKRISVTFLSKTEERLLFNEVNVALLMDHPHIARLFEVYQEENSLALCSEICEGGELLEHVQKVGRCSEREAAVITKQVCQAVGYMHSPGKPGGRTCHRDLKLENFMFMSKNSPEPHVKLIDFGLSKVVEKGSTMTLFAGTIHYMSPELLNHSYDYRCDLWALGLGVVAKDACDPGVGDGLVGSADLTLAAVEDTKAESDDDFEIVQALGTVNETQRRGTGQVRKADAFRVVEGIVARTQE